MLTPLPLYSSVAWSKLSEAQSLSLLVCKRKIIIPTLPTDRLLGGSDEMEDLEVFESRQTPYKHKDINF